MGHTVSKPPLSPASSRYGVRRLEVSDLAAVAEFEVEIAKISFPDDPITDPEFHKRRLERSIEQDGAFVATDLTTNQVVGWALVVSRENFSLKERYADFKSLYIVPAYRGGALVFHLMVAVENFAELNGLTRIAGRTAASNEDMKAVYERCGYHAVHIAFERTLDPPRTVGVPRKPVSDDGHGALRRRAGKPGRRKRSNQRS